MQTLSVLAALCDQPSQWQHGYSLAKQTGLKSGTLYYFRFKCLKTDDTYTDYSTTVHLLVQ